MSTRLAELSMGRASPPPPGDPPHVGLTRPPHFLIKEGKLTPSRTLTSLVSFQGCPLLACKTAALMVEEFQPARGAEGETASLHQVALRTARQGLCEDGGEPSSGPWSRTGLQDRSPD